MAEWVRVPVEQQRILKIDVRIHTCLIRASVGLQSVTYAIFGHVPNVKLGVPLTALLRNLQGSERLEIAFIIKNFLSRVETNASGRIINFVHS